MKYIILCCFLAVTPEERAAKAARDICLAEGAAAKINSEWNSASRASTTAFTMKARVPPQIVTYLQQPTGDHTHTCAANHTWDHKTNPTHNCTFPVIRNGKVEACGLPQYVVDNPRKMVTIGRVIR